MIGSSYEFWWEDGIPGDVPAATFFGRISEGVLDVKYISQALTYHSLWWSCDYHLWLSYGYPMWKSMKRGSYVEIPWDFPKWWIPMSISDHVCSNRSIHQNHRSHILAAEAGPFHPETNGSQGTGLDDSGGAWQTLLGRRKRGWKVAKIPVKSWDTIFTQCSRHRLMISWGIILPYIYIYWGL